MLLVRPLCQLSFCDVINENIVNAIQDKYSCNYVLYRLVYSALKQWRSLDVLYIPEAVSFLNFEGVLN